MKIEITGAKSMKIELSSDFIQDVEHTSKLIKVLNSSIDQMKQKLEEADFESLADPVVISVPDIKIKLLGHSDRDATLTVRLEVRRKEDF